MNIRAAYKPGSKRFAEDLSGISSTDAPLVFLLRHGQIRDHQTKRFIGRTDVPLDGTGRSQARSWQQAFAPIRFDAVYASPLGRCRETAAIVCPCHPAQIDGRINEINLGDWDGFPIDTIKKKYPSAFEERGRFMDTFRTPNGESFLDVKQRTLPFFQALPTAPGSRTLVVTHAGVIRTLLCHIQNRPLKDLFGIRPVYGQLFILDNTKQQPGA